MPSLRALHIHAFTDAPFGGSPAGVVFHGSRFAEETMRRIACDLGPSVNAFVDEEGRETGAYRLRCFTREGAEVQTYCGHATFAAAHAVLPATDGASVIFETISGRRRATRRGCEIELEIPQWPAVAKPCPPEVEAAVGAGPARFLRGPRDSLLVFDDEQQVRALTPDFVRMLTLGDVGFIACAPGSRPDEVVFRFFCPGFHIGEDEDPATGSAHSTLAPYWMERLGLERITTRQLSRRGAVFAVHREDNILTLTAPCAHFLEGEILA